jgi:hypothetical protein
LQAPKEIAYYVAPTNARTENFVQASDFAMSQPAFVPERHEIWFTDGTSGFYALRVSSAVWPSPAAPPPAGTKPAACQSTRRLTVHVRLPRGKQVRSIRATLNGRVVRAKRSGRVVNVPVDLRGMTRSTATLRVTVRLRGGKTITTRRVYHPCNTR